MAGVQSRRELSSRLLNQNAHNTKIQLVWQEKTVIYLWKEGSGELLARVMNSGLRFGKSNKEMMTHYLWLAETITAETGAKTEVMFKTSTSFKEDAVEKALKNRHGRNEFTLDEYNMEKKRAENAKFNLKSHWELSHRITGEVYYQRVMRHDYEVYKLEADNEGKYWLKKKLHAAVPSRLSEDGVVISWRLEETIISGQQWGALSGAQAMCLAKYNEITKGALDG